MGFFFFNFYFLAVPLGMWDFSSPTRDRTRTCSIGSRALTTREVPIAGSLWKESTVRRDSFH